MISLTHSRLYKDIGSKAFYHHGDFINATIRECIFFAQKTVHNTFLIYVACNDLIMNRKILSKFDFQSKSS